MKLNRFLSHFYSLIIILSLISCEKPKSDNYQRVEANRFELTDLVTNLNEPMELDFLPNDQIIFIERKGIVKVFDLKENISKVIGSIPISYVYESGLLGIAVDPDYVENNWVYFHHTPTRRPDHFTISRFKVRNDSLINSSEQVLLDYYYDYKKCCHNGGGLKFGPDGLLYISSGDNTGGTNYGPMDERPGNHLDDAQRSSANTMDYRGKILRIKPEADGSYSIPEGNLFDLDNPKALPEIYVMGARNPWKINVDRKTGWLHWGEVGPNPGRHDPQRGPDAQEEFNVAKKAGNYGWPYFIGDNKSYADYGYATGVIGDFFDPDHVINDSPNNSGLKELPPAQNALIWYPTNSSDSFPLLGIGGGSAVGGPIYHSEFYADQTSAFPSYYDNHWFIADWMRGWIYAAKLDEEGNYVSMEPFLEGHPFKKPIDIEMGPDGAMYVLDYGSNWYVHNRDARLTRISYNYGNRRPKAVIKASKKQSAVPVTIQFTASESLDLDEMDGLLYKWFINATQSSSTEVVLDHTFNTPGNHLIQLAVEDGAGLIDTAELLLNLGNEPPKVDIVLRGNRSFYSGNRPIAYNVKIEDEEDGISGSEIDPSAVEVDVRSIKEGTNFNMVHSTSAIEDPTFEYLAGKEIIEGSDCYSCHAFSEASVGPSFMAIAERFVDPKRWKKYLGEKILFGGFGSWGEKPMTGHPQHSEHEIDAMVDYILALDDDESFSNHGLSGSFVADHPSDYVLISARHKDKGGENAMPIEIEEKRLIRPYRIHATSYEIMHRVVSKKYNDHGGKYAEIMLNGSYIGFKEIDLNGISNIKIRLRSAAEWLRVEIKQDSPASPTIGSKRVDIKTPEDRWALQNRDWFDLEIPIKGEEGLRDLYIVSYSNRTEGDLIYFDICQMEWIEFVRQTVDGGRPTG